MRKLTAMTCAWVSLSLLQVVPVLACPFCAAVQQTLRQEMASMDAVVLAKIVKGGQTETDAEFEILDVVKGDKLAATGKKIRAAYFGSAPAETVFLIMGVDPPELLWSSPLPVTAKAIDYIKAIAKLPEAAQEQLLFYIKYLEHDDNLLARDAYDEFAQADYKEIKLIKDKMDRPQVLKWIQDVNLPPDRKRLFLVMLGVCGKPEDAQLIEKLLKSEDPNRRAGLDAMIACYVTLRGADGLPLIEELFLKNKQSQYADTYSAIMALRFHGTEGGIVERKRVLQALQIILQRPELADLVIPDLARWEDWTQIDRLVELFKKADDKTSWVRVPVINYLRVCPLPEAAKQLQELEAIDPAAFKRAKTFFPVPQPVTTPAAKQTSSIRLPTGTDGIAGKKHDKPADDRLGELPGATASRAADISTEAIVVVPSNRFNAACVMLMAASSVGIAMWLAITGAGNHGVLARAWAHVGAKSTGV